MARGKSKIDVELKEKTIKKILAKETCEAINIKKDIKLSQEVSIVKSEKVYNEITYIEFLNSTGISLENPVISIVIHLLKIILLVSSNTGAFLIGEQGTGKSALYSLFFKELCNKISGNITLSNLRGDARKNENNQGNDKDCLLEKDTIIFEEMMNDPKVNGDIIGLLKDCMESGEFLKGNSILTPTQTSFIFIGNNYSNFNNFTDITSKKLLEDLPKEFNDRAFFDRIPIILPHYYSLLGDIKYINEDDLIIPIIELENILKNIRQTQVEFILTDFKGKFSERETKFYNSIIFYLKCLFYQKDSKIPTWFLKGWIEFLKYFRKLLIGEYHNPFNKNSVKLILYLTGYEFDEVEYVAFDREDRLIIKLVDQKLFHKIALTGFGCRNNRLEIDYFYNNPNSNILPIKDIQKNDILLIQESGEYLPDKRIYLDNLREQHNSHHKTDEEFNKLVLTKIAKGEEGYLFRGIPKYFEKGLLLQAQEIFNKNITTINLEDFCFEKSEIKLLNFATYLKNN